MVITKGLASLLSNEQAGCRRAGLIFVSVLCPFAWNALVSGCMPLEGISELKIKAVILLRNAFPGGWRVQMMMWSLRITVCQVEKLETKMRRIGGNLLFCTKEMLEGS